MVDELRCESRGQTAAIVEDDDEWEPVVSAEETSVSTMFRFTPKAPDIPFRYTRKTEYVFPERLRKEGRWKAEAMASKAEPNFPKSIHVTMLYDFFDKFGDVFGLSQVAEEDLDLAITAKKASLFGRLAVRMIVQLARGFVALSGTDPAVVARRTETYKAISSRNYNGALWEFFEHDWMLLDKGGACLRNVLGPDKNSADFFELPSVVRAALMVDLCEYRLVCPDAKEVLTRVKHLYLCLTRCQHVKKMIRELSEPNDAHLQAVVAGRIDGCEYYYAGGLRVYRLRKLSVKEFGMIANERQRKRSTAPVMEGVNEARRDHCDRVTDSCSSTLYGQSQNSEEEALTFRLNDPLKQDYFATLFEPREVWELVCRGEDDAYMMAECLRNSRSPECLALSINLMYHIIPSMQRVAHLRAKAARKEQRTKRLGTNRERYPSDQQAAGKRSCTKMDVERINLLNNTWKSTGLTTAQVIWQRVPVSGIYAVISEREF